MRIFYICSNLKSISVTTPYNSNSITWQEIILIRYAEKRKLIFLIFITKFFWQIHQAVMGVWFTQVFIHLLSCLTGIVAWIRDFVVTSRNKECAVSTMVSHLEGEIIKLSSNTDQFHYTQFYTNTLGDDTNSSFLLPARG